MPQTEGIAPHVTGTIIKCVDGDPVPFEIVRVDNRKDVPPKVLFRRPGVAPPESYAIDPNYDPACERADYRKFLQGHAQ